MSSQALQVFSLDQALTECRVCCSFVTVQTDLLPGLYNLFILQVYLEPTLIIYIKDLHSCAILFNKVLVIILTLPMSSIVRT